MAVKLGLWKCVFDSAEEPQAQYSIGIVLVPLMQEVAQGCISALCCIAVPVRLCCTARGGLSVVLLTAAGPARCARDGMGWGQDGEERHVDVLNKTVK